MASSAIFNFCLKSADLADRLHVSCAHDLPQGGEKDMALFSQEIHKSSTKRL